MFSLNTHNMEETVAKNRVFTSARPLPLQVVVSFTTVRHIIQSLMKSLYQSLLREDRHTKTYRTLTPTIIISFGMDMENVVCISNLYITRIVTPPSVVDYPLPNTK
jgi:hypothetical protein